MGVPQKGHFRLSALSQLTVSLICLPHLEHVISSGKLSKNIVLFTECTNLLYLASVARFPLLRIALECELSGGLIDSRRYVINPFWTLYDSRRFVIESRHDRRP